MLNRTTPPNIKDAIEFDLQLKPYKKMVLNNGVEVYTIDAGEQDVLQMEMVFYAGNSFEKNNAVAAATSYMLKNGTSTKTAFELNEAFEYYGAYCNRTCRHETASVTLHTLSKHTGVLLPVIKEMIADSIFSEDELAIYKQNSKQKLSVNLQKCDFVANRLIDAYLFGEDHPYGKYIAAADYDALTTEQLKDHFNEYYLNGHCVIFVAGKLPAGLFELLNTAFGTLALKPGGKLIIKNIAPITIKKHRVSNDPDGVQGAIRIARDFPNRHHPDFMKMMVLNTVFGGFFGSRLMSNIREEKGYTYGIHSYVQNHFQDTTALLISTEAGKDVAEATVAEIYKEMEILREELIDEEELLLVRNYLIGSILGDLDGPFHIIGRWKNIILNNLDEQYFYDSIKMIKTIPAEELMELANKYLQPEAFYELIVI